MLPDIQPRSGLQRVTFKLFAVNFMQNCMKITPRRGLVRRLALPPIQKIIEHTEDRGAKNIFPLSGAQGFFGKQPELPVFHPKRALFLQNKPI